MIAVRGSTNTLVLLFTRELEAYVRIWKLTLLDTYLEWSCPHPNADRPKYSTTS